MMTALLLYAYCQGIYSSRGVAKAAEERVDFMAVAGMQRPDVRTVNDFRKRHLKALKERFVQVDRIWQRAGLFSLGHVALDGTQVLANASKHKAMSSRRMCQAEAVLRGRAGEWMAKAQALVDASHQIIVAQGLNAQAADAPHLSPMLQRITANTGRQATELSADAGYCSEANLKGLNRHHVRPYVATGRQSHGQTAATGTRPPEPGTRVQAMAARLRRGANAPATGWANRWWNRCSVRSSGAVGFDNFCSEGSRTWPVNAV